MADSRRGVAAFVVGAVAVAAVGVAGLRVFADDPMVSVDVSADAVQTAVRGTSVQVLPLPAPPVYGGCMPGGVTTSTVVAPGGSWSFALVNNKWRMGFRGVAGRKGPLVIVGDSLTYLTINETMARLIDAGYGPICIDAGYGRYSTLVGLGQVSTGVAVVARIKASDPVWQLGVVRWTVALGTNDVVQTNNSKAAQWAASQIAAMRSAIGAVNGPLYFVNVRTRRGSTQNTENAWNAALLGAGVAVIDWSLAVSASPTTYIKSDDLIHLTPAGVVLRSTLVGGALAAA